MDCPGTLMQQKQSQNRGLLTSFLKCLAVFPNSNTSCCVIYLPRGSGDGLLGYRSWLNLNFTHLLSKPTQWLYHLCHHFCFTAGSLWVESTWLPIDYAPCSAMWATLRPLSQHPVACRPTENRLTMLGTSSFEPITSPKLWDNISLRWQQVYYLKNVNG